jgi:hypothetical protein
LSTLLFHASISFSRLECISQKEPHTHTPTGLLIDKIKYSPHAYAISGTSPHFGHGFSSAIVQYLHWITKVNLFHPVTTDPIRESFQPWISAHICGDNNDTRDAP